MRYLLVTVVLMLTSCAAIAADFNTGMAAFERQDYATAIREFSALAEAGDPQAQYMLGRLYAQGNGVVQDYAQAHKWYNVAASRGYGHAAEARDALAKQMPSAQISQAQRLAAKWKPGANVASVETPPAARPATVQEMNAAIQKSLNELGYDAGPADGAMGGKTRAAIRDYQSDHGMSVDGQPSDALLQHLTEALRRAAIESKTPAPATADASGRRLLLHDAFQDGDYTKGPAWTVTAGRFSVEQGIGLRTVHEARQPPAETRLEDLPITILGAILDEATRPAGSTAPAESPDYAEIYVAEPISNAFAMQFKLTLRQPSPGPVAFGPYQGKGQTGGYRLVYTPNEARGLHLVRLTESGSSVIESVDSKFSPNRQYSVEWTRNRQGKMAVSVDGKEVLQVTDRSFMDPFDGFTLINRGGDYALREIAIYGID